MTHFATLTTFECRRLAPVKTTISGLLCSLILCSSVVFAALPDDIAALPPGHWLEVPNSRMDTVTIPPSEIDFFPSDIMNAWNSGAYDTTRNRLIVWGGGHRGYIGNEIYVFDVATAQWQRLTDPTCYRMGCDPLPAAPVSTHTYDALEYLPNVDRFIEVGGGIWPDGAPTPATWLFDFVTLSWTRGQDMPSTASQFWAQGKLSDYDPVSGKFIVRGRTRVADYDPTTDRWTLHSNTVPMRRFGWTGALDFNSRKFVTAGLYFNDTLQPPEGFGHIMDISSSGRLSNQQPLEALGDTTIQTCDGPGLVYDPTRQVFVAYCARGDVYSLHASDRVWIRHPAAGGDIPIDPYSLSRQYNGTYGRWRYMPDYDAYILVTHIDRNVYVYKPAEDIGSPGSALTLSATPNPVAAGQSTTLSWTGANLTDCMASGGWTGPRPMSGSETSIALISTTEFRLSCGGLRGPVERSVTVNVDAPSVPRATVAIFASPIEVAVGADTILTWSSTNATECEASGAWNGSRPLAGSELISGVTGDSTYTMSCTNGVEWVSDAAAVTVMELGTDSDADGLLDDWEMLYFGDLEQSAAGDPDNDSLDNGSEYTAGTDPQKSDTDGDGFSDGEEIDANEDPLDPSSFPESPASEEDSGGGALGWPMLLSLLALGWYRRRQLQLVKSTVLA